MHHKHDSVHVEDLRAGSFLTLSGVAAETMQAYLDHGEESRLLKLLASRYGMKHLFSLLRGTRVPLNPSNALRLGGFDTLFLELVGTCNERCKHCYAGSSPDIKERLPKELCIDVIRDASTLGFKRVQFTGGEPLLCKFLPELIAEARRVGIETCEIYSNGTLLDESLFSKLMPLAPSFAFSVYSADEKTHDSITGLRGSHKKTLAAIRRVVNADLPARVAIVLMQQNADHEETTRAMLEETGVTSISVSVSHAVGRGDYFVDTHKASTHRASGGSHRPANSKTRALRGALCVSYSGEVYPCIFNRQHGLGNIRERSLRSIVEQPSYASQHSGSLPTYKRLECGACQVTANALGRCSNN